MTICQSITITRFLANECGLAGKDAIENAKIDEVVDAVSDLLTARVKLFSIKRRKIENPSNLSMSNHLKTIHLGGRHSLGGGVKNLPNLPTDGSKKLPTVGG